MKAPGYRRPPVDKPKVLPTFHHSRHQPATATPQLDVEFASASLADQVNRQALNQPQQRDPATAADPRLASVAELFASAGSATPWSNWARDCCSPHSPGNWRC